MYRIKYTESFVRERIAETAHRLQQEGILNDQVVYLVMLSGGIWFAQHLMDSLGTISNAIYYVKGHSYRGKERGEFVWDYLPQMDIQGKQVVVLDDICDSGATTNALFHYLTDAKASRIEFVTLLQRATAQLDNGIRVHTCIMDDSKDFFVGCGLDDNDLCRNLPYVGVIE